MNERLDDLVQGLRVGELTLEEIYHLSDGELRYVALASGHEARMILDESTIETWHHLPPHWRAAVCRWRGWPEEWAGPEQEWSVRELGRVSATLDAIGVPSRGCPMLHSPAGRVRWLANQLEKAREALARLVAVQNGPPLERDHDEWDDAMRGAENAISGDWEAAKAREGRE